MTLLALIKLKINASFPSFVLYGFISQFKVDNLLISKFWWKLLRSLSKIYIILFNLQKIYSPSSEDNCKNETKSRSDLDDIKLDSWIVCCAPFEGSYFIIPSS